MSTKLLLWWSHTNLCKCDLALITHSTTQIQYAFNTIKDFQITSANILLTLEHNKCLNGAILHVYPLNELISNVML